MARILVVDDSPDTLQLVRATLESAGHHVVGVADPLTALGQLRTQTIEAAVLDIMMPGLSGWELLESIRREPGHERLPIVFLSAIGDAGNRTRGIRLGADDFLAKPFDPEELLARLEGLMNRGAAPVTGLSGNLDSHPISEVIQNLEQNAKTGTLEVLCGSRRGQILFAAGKIAAAEFDGYQDRVAVLTLFDERRGHFRFLSGPVEAGRTRIEPSALLIEAAWIEDELAVRRHLLPSNDERLTLGADLPAIPDGLKALPIQEVATAIEAAQGTSLDKLLADRRFPPATLRLTVAWLVQIGALGAGGGTMSRPILDRSLERFLREVAAPRADQPVEIVLIVHAPAWDTVAPLLSSLPANRVDEQDMQAGRRVWQQRGGEVVLRSDERSLRLTFDTFHNPEGALTADALENAAAIVLWVSEELAFEGLERLLKELEAAAPATSRLLVVGALGALARGPRWSAAPTAPESFEELLYELSEARA
ncbi:MAG: response regulator [Thermoanaerobaculia bacterium]|nr:response regulator [Thermoanaerobaculia bacterium]